MDMRNVKKMALIGITCLPLMANATGLTIINNTSHDSTSIINNGGCSAALLGESGISRAHSPTFVTEFKMKLACGKNKTACQAKVFMSADCSGPSIATVKLNLSSGIFDVENQNIGGYVVSGSQFQATIDGA